MTNRYRSLVSAVALLVLMPASGALAQIVDGQGPNLGLGNVDVTIGGANAVVEGVVGAQPNGDPVAGIGEPGGIDADVDAGNLADVHEGNRPGNSRTDFSILSNDPDNDGASAVVDALGGTPVAINLGQNGEMAGIHVDNNGDGVADIVIPMTTVDNVLDNGAIETIRELDLPVVGNLLSGDQDNLAGGPGGRGPVEEFGVPGNIDSALANLADMSPAQRRALRMQCQNILADPGNYESSLVALCSALR